LQAALAEENWQRAIEIVTIMQSVAPDGEEVQRWGVTTYLEYGQALVRAGRIHEAKAQFDQSVALDPEDEEAALWQETTGLYLAGLESLTAGLYDQAIESFTEALKQPIASNGSRPCRAASGPWPSKP
jgi:tetratricopeptide (TPR) repeat protein